MTVKVLNSEILFQGRIISLVKERIILDNGATTDSYIFRHPGASAIVPFSDREKVILVKQYRHSVGEYLWEIPAGTLLSQESPLACAQRELIEETGFSAKTWHGLGSIIPGPGYSDERIYLFLAENLSHSEQQLDSDEVLQVHEIALDEAIEMISCGRIQDAKSVCGLLRARQWINAK